MRVTYNVQIVVNKATASQTDTAVAAAIRSAVAGLSGFGGSATVYVLSQAGNSGQDITKTKITPTYPA
jgi:hypothetical protein